MYSADFITLRDALLRLDDDDRRRVADLVGAMNEPKPPISGELAGILRLVAALDAADRQRLARWCSRYLSRWGQIPAAASRRLATPAAGNDTIGAARKP